METNELSKNARGGTELQLEELHKRVDPELLSNFQIIPSRVRQIDKSKKAILWCHDTASDPEVRHLSDEASRNRFAGFVLPSDWSMQAYNATLGLPYSKSMVLKNAIDPIEWHEKSNDGVIRLIYHTTPHRGLGILVPVFEHIVQSIGDQVTLQLDVYSSFSIYGWGERDKPYEALFERCRQHPNINYHGSVSNDVVRAALQQSDIFAYPSIWPETFCIAAVEALSAMNLVVCPNYAALPETTANWAHMYQWTEIAQDHANRFAFQLLEAINAIKTHKETGNLRDRLSFQKQYTDAFYSWDLRAQQWTQYLHSLL